MSDVFERIEAERLDLLSKLVEDRAADPNQAPGLIDGLRSAESAFVVYREETCDSVYQEFIDGTIRGAAYQLCRIDLTRDHNRFLAKRASR